MNKRILISLSVIGAVAAIAVGGTIAYFSDTETSTGNTFTAGTLDLKVDSTCHYYQNGQSVTCIDGNWEKTDLGVQKFFNFTDVKPGDSGEDTISLTVINNPAWACMYIKDIVNSEGDCTEPEDSVDEVGVAGCGDNGELQNNLLYTIWVEDDCNNILDSGERVIMTDALITADTIIKIADSTVGVPLAGNVKKCVGVKWNVPSATGNIIQGDGLTETVSLYVEQFRNNPNFRCVQPVVSVTDTWSVVDTDTLGGSNGKEWFAKANFTQGQTEWVGIKEATGFQTAAYPIWDNGVEEPFTLVYDGAGNASFTIKGSTVTHPVGVGSYGRIGINVKARLADRTTDVSNLVFSLGSVSPDNISVTNGLKSLTISGVDMSGAWTLSGKIKFSWNTSGWVGENQAVQFSID